MTSSASKPEFPFRNLDIEPDSFSALPVLGNRDMREAQYLPNQEQPTE